MGYLSAAAAAAARGLRGGQTGVSVACVPGVLAGRQRGKETRRVICAVGGRGESGGDGDGTVPQFFTFCRRGGRLLI